jgi:hypothetical protein
MDAVPVKHRIGLKMVSALPEGEEEGATTQDLCVLVIEDVSGTNGRLVVPTPRIVTP